MKSKTSVLFLACLLLMSGQIKKQASSQNNEKTSIKQRIATTGNELKVITYLVGHGRIEGSLGTSVAGVGDINSDGFDDVIVGKPGKGAGEALILFGGTKMDSIPDIILHGENDGDNFGSNVTSGGDINGDSMGDFIVAAPGYPNRTAFGRIYIYWGGTKLDTLPDVTLTGEYKYDNFGFRITAGKINEDNLNDLLITSINYYFSDTCLVCGKSYLYFGSEITSGLPAWTNQGDTSKTYLGAGVAIGDLNGDNRGDLLISSVPGASGKGAQTITEIFLNSAQIDTLSDMFVVDSLYGNATDDILYSQDFNLDGFDDFITRHESNLNIYYGNSLLDTIPDAKLTPWYLAGINRLADAGDVNGDGYPDVFAGAWHVVFEGGSVGLYLGSSKINSEVDWVTGGGGYSIDGAGDVNGDGYDDLIVSSLSSQLTNVATGVVWILAGRPDLKDIGTKVETKLENIPPEDFKLFQNYPNPFKNETIFRFQQAQKFSKPVKLTIFDTTGKEVVTLVNQLLSAGEYNFKWNGTSQEGKEVTTGVYFSRLSIGQRQQVIKLIRL